MRYDSPFTQGEVMPRSAVFSACLALAVLSAAGAGAQSVYVYQTTPDLSQALAQSRKLHFSAKAVPASTAPLIAVDDTQRFQEIDGFGASLTDAAAWLFAKKLTPAQTDAAFKSLFSRKDGIAVSFLRQPIGSSDLSATVYSYDDLCVQGGTTACTTPAGVNDYKLEHYSLQHDEEYILPELRQALAINPDLKVILTPWSPPGWMKTSGSMIGSSPDEKVHSSLRPEAYDALANYLVKTIQGYQAAGVPIFGVTMQNEPLYAPPTYSGMQMEAIEQAAFLANNFGPALAAAHLTPKVMVWDHNWDKWDYPETVLKDPKAYAFSAGTAWHHYGGEPSVMTKNHQEFPDKDQWVTEASGETNQKGNILAQGATELVDVIRNWARSYVLWAVATDQKNGPHVGGCDICRGLVTIDLTDPAKPAVKPEADYYIIGQASKFVLPGAVRIASDEPAGTQLKDVAFRNPDGTVVLYTVNNSATSQEIRIGFHGKTAAATISAGAVATFVWK
jgi:glucosylceramidase